MSIERELATRAALRRWNPAGARLLRRIDGGDPGFDLLALLGPAGVGVSTMAAELTRRAGIRADDRPNPIDGIHAAVTLILLDAGTPTDRSTLRTLAAAAASGSRVVLALNKIDAHAGWRTVADQDRDRIAEQLGGPDRPPPIHPVSALTGHGLAELIGELRVAFADAPARAADRLVRARAHAVAIARGRLTDEMAAIRAAGDIAELRAERARLAGDQMATQAESLRRLRSQFQLARLDLSHEVGVTIRALSVELRDELSRSDRARLRDYPARLTERVAATEAALGGAIAARIADIGRQVLIEPLAAAPFALEPPGAEPATPPPPPSPRRPGLEDKLVVAVGASAGLSLGRLAVSPLSLVPALDMATVPATLLLGAGAAWWLTRSRGQLADRAHLRQWTTDTLTDVKAQLDQRVAAALVAAEVTTAERLTRRSADGVGAANRRIAALDAELHRASAGASGRLAACAADLTALDRHPAGEPIRAEPRPNGQGPEESAGTATDPGSNDDRVR
ncbi:hypothetical protein [Skermania piniformis]|uniref:Dynamin family protein n=1 Tax=Skermania pinensis TaxID=39122 RepID=A0ABX8S7D7_9ACTN|nr:hypothetical protein [Skermania piniformis]QXQ13758.1 hypothetical protein KV203_18550 [Skermania piniformis]